MKTPKPGTPGPIKPPRTEILEEAATLINGQRDNSYGDPVDNFATTAALWEAYLSRAVESRDSKFTITTYDVAVMMALVKVARIAKSPEKRDHWTDLAGYTGCGWDCVTREVD